MDIQISIIIVNFNTAELLRSCIQSLESDTNAPPYEIIVIDNNSSDNSVRMLRSDFPQIKVIENNSNAGYARGNNQGLEIARGKYVWLLNPDTIVIRNCLKTLFEFMETTDNAGAVSPRTWLDENKSLEVCSLKILTPGRAKAVFTQLPCSYRKKLLNEIWELDLKVWQTADPVCVEGIGGAAFFISRKLLDQLGNLDERFFMGYEDTDLSASISAEKLNIYIHPNAELIHLFGQAKQLPEAPQKAIYAWQTAPMTFLSKHFGENAAKNFKIQRYLDRIWRRLQFRKHLNNQNIPDENGITLNWHGPETNYVVEISNDTTFYDKFGKIVQGTNIRLDKSLLNRLAQTKWYWRVLPANTRQIKEIISGGHWHWKKEQKNT